jgi:hypothetical protein
VLVVPVLLLTVSCATAENPGHRPLVRIVAYPLNRVLDLTDVVSFSAGAYLLDPLHFIEQGKSEWNVVVAAALFLPGFGFEAHATRAMQVGFASVWGPEAGWWPGRELAVGTRRATLAGLGPCSAGTMARTRWGTRGTTRVEEVWGSWSGGDPTDLVFDTPLDSRHLEHRDYWGVGLTACYLLGVSFELHPVEVADLVAGLLFVDFRWDDIGHRR